MDSPTTSGKTERPLPRLPGDVLRIGARSVYFELTYLIGLAHIYGTRAGTKYFRAIRDQQVTTDYHLDRLAAGMTPAKKRKTRNHVLYKICGDFLEYDSVLNYMFKVAEYFGHEL